MRYEILPGLPGTGPMYQSFGETDRGAYREGFVVRFHPRQNAAWVGNFQPGQHGLTGVFEHPAVPFIFVLVQGLAYVVDPESNKAIELFGGTITEWIELPEQATFLAGDGLCFTCLDVSGVAWRTRRISWDGFQNVRIVGETVCGEAFSPVTNEWIPFCVDLNSGAAKGGSYDGDPE